jgi:hypothetical protein
MNMEEKNVFSHRAKAIELLKDFLSKAWDWKVRHVMAKFKQQRK